MDLSLTALSGTGSGRPAFSGLPGPSPRPSGSRLAGLDALRGLAILGVFLYHFVGEVVGWTNFNQWDGFWRRAQTAPGLPNWVAAPISLGWAGVALFFVLSGFVIHLSFLQSGSPNLRVGRFYLRRFWRIYPPYLAALLFFAWVHRMQGYPPSRFDLVSHLFLVHDFSRTTFYSICGSFWSLAVEVQFYLLYPLVLWARSRFGMGKVLAGMVILGLAGQVVAMPCPPALWHSWALGEFLPQWSNWVLGAFVAERFVSGRPLFRNPWLAVPVLTLVFVASTRCNPTNLLSFSLASVASAALLDGVVRRGRLTWPERLLVPFGLISYSFYLWQQPLILLLLGYFQRWGLVSGKLKAQLTVGLVLVFLTVTALSALLYLTLERWSARRGRSRITRRPSAPGISAENQSRSLQAPGGRTHAA